MLSFQFQTLMDFLWMAGHGPYVWVSYLASALTIGLLVLLPYYQRRHLCRQLARQQRLAQGQPVQR